MSEPRKNYRMQWPCMKSNDKSMAMGTGKVVRPRVRTFSLVVFRSSGEIAKKVAQRLYVAVAYTHTSE